MACFRQWLHRHARKWRAAWTSGRGLGMVALVLSLRRRHPLHRLPVSSSPPCPYTHAVRWWALPIEELTLGPKPMTARCVAPVQEETMNGVTHRPSHQPLSRRGRSAVVRIACGWLLAVTPVSRAAAIPNSVPAYSITDLSALYGFNSGSYAINNLGQIVGYYGDGVAIRAFILDKGVFTPIDVPGAIGECGTIASGINDAGQIVGQYCVGSTHHGFVLEKNNWTRIDVPGGVFTAATAINRQGQIVGLYTDGLTIHGFLLNKGAFKAIDAPVQALFTEAFGINDRSQITGAYMSSDGKLHGFVMF